MSRVGRGQFMFAPVPLWEQLPAGWKFVEAVGVATDSRDRVFVFNRGEHPVIVFDRDGRFLEAWGEGQFVRPHGIWIGSDDAIYLTDDLDHTVQKYTPDGRLLWKLGKSGHGSDTGVQKSDYRTINRGGPPFNQPTNLTIGADGSLYISDGYGNARIHKYSPDGKLLLSWGEPGAGPGQFNLPHGIGIVSSGRVLVADRENSRIQVFSPDGEFLAEWTDVVRPCEVFVDPQDNVFVAELGHRAGMFAWMKPDLTVSGGRISIFNRSGSLLARFGGGEKPGTPGDFFAPHDLWVDLRGDLYVAEVTWSAGGNRGLVSPDCPSLQKLVRVNEQTDAT
jgi:DNA-binding beta-propeller fold protein YncE